MTLEVFLGELSWTLLGKDKDMLRKELQTKLYVDAIFYLMKFDICGISKHNSLHPTQPTVYNFRSSYVQLHNDNCKEY